MITLALPLPPSTNRLYTRSRTTGSPVLSEAQRTYRVRVWAAVQEQVAPDQRDLSGSRLEVIVWVGGARHRDLDNLLKALLDSLGEALHFDDRHVDRLVVERHGGPDRPEIEVMVRELTREL